MQIENPTSQLQSFALISRTMPIVHYQHIQSNTIANRNNCFVPTPAKPNRKSLVSDINTFNRRLRIAFLMRNKRSKNHPFKPPSKWQPKSSPSAKLEEYLEATKFELAHIRLRNRQKNMTTQELSAINKLKNNPDIVVKPYDK